MPFLEVQYLEQYKIATGKELCIGKDNEVTQGNKSYEEI